MSAVARPVPGAPDLPLDGRVAVVTGASGGIGAATARRPELVVFAATRPPHVSLGRLIAFPAGQPQ